MNEAVESDRVIVMDKGEIILDDIPENVFSQAEEMKNIGLDIPQVSELVYLLGKEGIKLDSHIITENECVNALYELLKG